MMVVLYLRYAMVKDSYDCGVLQSNHQMAPNAYNQSEIVVTCEIWHSLINDHGQINDYRILRYE
jgi:hypothetical protein